jgi:hypothetical protein
MEDFNRAGDATVAMQNLKAMSARLTQAAEDVGNWKVDITYEVVPSTLDFKITVVKGNGQGFIKTISFDDIQYYASDSNELAAQLIDDIFTKLYRPMLQQQIRPAMSRAVQNICKMGEKK